MFFSSHRVLLVLLSLCLFACDKTLVTGLSEADGNEVLGVLLAVGIEADKSSADNGKTWNISVPEAHMVKALDLIQQRGLPRKRHANLGEMFKKDGLISTPVEERVRFVYGVSQELAETLSRIDGVVTARVHIVMPNNDPLARESKLSSASVFVKHRAEFPVAALAAPIKNLVSASVEGLRYENVSVTFVAAESSPIVAGSSGESMSGSTRLLIGVGVFLTLAGFAFWWCIDSSRRDRLSHRFELALNHFRQLWRKEKTR